MFDICRPKQKPIVIIRAATGHELSTYEKRKLANIEENAQENRIENISLSVDGDIRRIAPLNKEVRIDLGQLALKSSIAPADISSEELFVISCALEDAYLDE